jgi:hypothetical protein
VAEQRRGMISSLLSFELIELLDHPLHFLSFPFLSFPFLPFVSLLFSYLSQFTPPPTQSRSQGSILQH